MKNKNDIVLNKEKEIFLYEVASNVRKRRTSLRLSAEELAEKANRSVSLVRQIEGGTRNVTIDSLFCVSKALEIEPWMLMKNCYNQNDKIFENEILMLANGLNDNAKQDIIQIVRMLSNWKRNIKASIEEDVGEVL